MVKSTYCFPHHPALPKCFIYHVKYPYFVSRLSIVYIEIVEDG